MNDQEKIIKIDVSGIPSIGIMKLVEVICAELSKQEILLNYDLNTYWTTDEIKNTPGYKELMNIKENLREQYHQICIQYGEICRKEREEEKK